MIVSVHGEDHMTATQRSQPYHPGEVQPASRGISPP